MARDNPTILKKVCAGLDSIPFLRKRFGQRGMKRVFLLLLVLAACVAPAPAPVPESSASEAVPAGIENEARQVVCWDNSTVSAQEDCPQKPAKVVMEEPENAVPVVQPGRKYLEEAKTKFKGYAYLLEDRMVITLQNRSRHYFFRTALLENRQPVTDIYFDLENQTAVAYCNLDRESKMVSGNFDFERSQCKDFIDKPIEVEFSKAYVKGPLDYLEQYADREPLLVEDNIQTISIGGNSKSVQPSLHYLDSGRRTILRLDKRYHVPLKIEREGDKSVDFRDTFADVMVLDGKQFKIDASWVTYQNVSAAWSKASTK